MESLPGMLTVDCLLLLPAKMVLFEGLCQGYPHILFQLRDHPCNCNWGQDSKAEQDEKDLAGFLTRGN